jgi:hypothetical protein
MRLQTRSDSPTNMAASPTTGDSPMKRAIFVALGTGVLISSAAAALDIAGAAEPAAPIAQNDPVQVARVRESAREEQRSRIQSRYAAERESCAQLRGYQREKCVVKAHANRGRALLEAAAPYENRL